MRKTDYSLLFKPLTLPTVTLRNKIVVPPMVSCRNIVEEDGIKWYRRFAAGGAGVVIVEATPLDHFSSLLTVEGLRKLVEAVHNAGAAIAIQLFPVPWGSSLMPQDLSEFEIEKIKSRYRQAAAVCKEAGFDGVEPHGAHGFILNQFFSPLKNLRSDRYGGSLENRMSMGREIVRAIREEAGNGLLILYRHTPYEEGGYTIADSIEFARALRDDGVDIMDISPASEVEPADLAAPIKEAINCPVIAVNDMDDPRRACKALAEKRADLIAIGRGLIADAEWPKKIAEGRFDELVVCRKCDAKCNGNLAKGIPVECIQW